MAEKHFAENDAPRSITTPTFLVDLSMFCGQAQPHSPHRWVVSSGFYAACSGKSCACVFPPAETTEETR